MPPKDKATMVECKRQNCDGQCPLFAVARGLKPGGTPCKCRTAGCNRKFVMPAGGQDLLNNQPKRQRRNADKDVKLTDEVAKLRKELADTKAALVKSPSSPNGASMVQCVGSSQTLLDTTGCWEALVPPRNFLCFKKRIVFGLRPRERVVTAIM